MSVTIQHIREGIRALGLSGKPLCIHASLRSFGQVEGGARTVIEGVLEEGCTLMMPTFSWSALGVPAPEGVRPRRNGTSPVYAEFLFRHTEVYDHNQNVIDRYDMGMIPSMLLQRKDRLRGDHPLCSFAAVGPLAKALVSHQTWDDVYAPFRALIDLHGWVLMMGVGLRRMTLLHYAEQRAGRNLFLRWANAPNGSVVGVEVGGCSEGFDHFDSVLRPLERQQTVGLSLWRAFPARQTLTAAAAAIRRDRYFTHCGSSFCARCDDAAVGGRVIE
ncbi:MAG: AAC(3) family N-acetyltransferase [bacterium]|nr:AAC(3) family N-acetyltransferase [bacterium]